MIIFSLLILFYLKCTKPFRHDFNNYLATVSQLFLALFYGQCLLFSVLADDEHTDFRKMLGLCLCVSILVYMIFYFIIVLIIYFKKSKCKYKDGKISLVNRIKKKGLVMQQIFGTK